jgi:transcriptional regulator with XRE-family HTH domain
MTGQNLTDSDNSGLSHSQNLAIEILLTGKRDREVADMVGTSRQTINEWRRNSQFSDELDRRRRELFAETHKRLQQLSDKALNVLETNLDSDNPIIAVRAAQLLLKFANV